MVLYITCEVKKLFESCVDREIYCTENIGLEKHILRISLSGCGKLIDIAVRLWEAIEFCGRK